MRVSLLEPGPVVAYEEHRRAPFHATPDLDVGACALVRELPGVGEEVVEHDPCGEEAGVPLRLAAPLDDELDTPLRLPFEEPGRALLREAGEVHPLAHDLAAGHLREPEQAVDELRHLVRRPPHPGEVAAPLRIELVGAVLLERLAEAVDGAEGRPQIVGDRVAERLELLVRGLGRLRRGLQGGGGLARLGDVLRDPEQVFGRSLVVEDRDLLGVEPALTGLRLDRLFRNVLDHARVDRLAIARLEELRLAAGEEVEVVLPDQGGPAEAEQLFTGPVDPLEAQLARLLHEDHVGDVLDDRSEELLVRPQRLLRAPPPRDLAPEAAERDDEDPEARQRPEHHRELRPADVAPRPAVAAGEDAVLVRLDGFADCPYPGGESEPSRALSGLAVAPASRDVRVERVDSLVDERRPGVQLPDLVRVVAQRDARGAERARHAGVGLRKVSKLGGVAGDDVCPAGGGRAGIGRGHVADVLQRLVRALDPAERVGGGVGAAVREARDGGENEEREPKPHELFRARAGDGRSFLTRQSAS